MSVLFLVTIYIIEPEFVEYFLFWSASLQVLSLLLVGEVQNLMTSIVQTHGPSHVSVDHGPNLGMHWYLFIQMFQRFQTYFVVVWSGLPYVFIVPIALRLHRYPLEMVSSMYVVSTNVCVVLVLEVY